MARRSAPPALAAAGLLLALILWLAGQRRVSVRGRSMVPALDENELVLVDLLAYWPSALRCPRRGDLVLADGQTVDGPSLLLKRVAGLPGEVVTLARDTLLIDGEPLDLGRAVVGSSPGAWALGPDDYFLLSENLAVGTDSRHVGPFTRSQLRGRAWLVYGPEVRWLARSGGR
ncbi:MAG: signal peptidase I [Chloroflexi bacterium]|nr:signal peptidase I [Chloroflexota bacterium]